MKFNKIFNKKEITVLVRKVSEFDVKESKEDLEIWCKFVHYHYANFEPEQVRNELFQSIMDLTENPERALELWEDMTN